jgi:fatty-acyl-CoA synthase
VVTGLFPLRGSDLKAGWIDVTTVGDCVDRAAERWEHDALVFPHERVTYPELAARVDHFARGLVGLGIGYQDKVGVLMPPGVDYLAAVLGATKIGATAVPVNARFKSVELRHIVVNSDMALLFTSDEVSEYVDFPALLEEAFPGLATAPAADLHMDDAPHLRHVVLDGAHRGDGYLSRQAFDAAAATVADGEIATRRHMVRLRDTAVIMYTSGTTAAPKGAMLSHEALVRKGVLVARTRFDLTPDERMWTALPLYHIGGIAFAFACFSAGTIYCHSGAFAPDVSLRQLADERCTVAIPAFETIWLMILEHPDFPRTDLSALRLVFNVGVPERLRGMQEKLPNAVQVSGYGSTEATSFLTLGEVTDPLDLRVETTGSPLPGLQVRIRSIDTGEDMGPGEVGEIVFRGWTNFDGYYNDEELTRSVIDRDGWFASGDLGTIDDDGRLVFVTRLKDMLKVGGENVAAVEVEGYLLRHPAVQFAQVVAAPDARYVEVPAAYVQLKAGASATAQELIDFCIGRIATFKVPRYIRFVDEWPMSGTKIQKYVLRDRIGSELREQGITQAPKIETRR